MRILRKATDLPNRSLWQKIKDVALTDVAVLARGGVSAGSLEQLEQLLLEADFGVPTTLKLVADVERLAQRGLVKTQAQFLRALEDGIAAALRAGNSEPALTLAANAPTSGPATLYPEYLKALRPSEWSAGDKRGVTVPARGGDR